MSGSFRLADVALFFDSLNVLKQGELLAATSEPDAFDELLKEMACEWVAVAARESGLSDYGRRCRDAAAKLSQGIVVPPASEASKPSDPTKYTRC